MKQYVYELLLGLWEQTSDVGIRHAIIQGLSRCPVFRRSAAKAHLLLPGVIFRAYPTMMLEESSTNLMDQCFSTDATSPETVLRMLTLLYDCLSAEKTEIEPAGKPGRGQKKTGKSAAQQIAMSLNPPAIESDNIDISKLIGNTSNFAESGYFTVLRDHRRGESNRFLLHFSVNSAIVQRYLDKILESSLSVFADIQKVAMDILALTIDQGLAHPMQVSPYFPLSRETLQC